MKKLISLLLAAVMVCTLVSAFAESEVPYELENGGFETGTLAGWTPVSGNWAKD